MELWTYLSSTKGRMFSGWRLAYVRGDINGGCRPWHWGFGYAARCCGCCTIDPDWLLLAGKVRTGMWSCGHYRVVYVGNPYTLAFATQVFRFVSWLPFAAARGGCPIC